MDMIGANISLDDYHIVFRRDHPQQIPEPEPDLPAQHWIPVLRLPYPVVLQVCNRVGTTPIPRSIYHPLFPLKR
jgi:hypothetical protein